MTPPIGRQPSDRGNANRIVQPPHHQVHVDTTVYDLDVVTPPCRLVGHFGKDRASLGLRSNPGHQREAIFVSKTTNPSSVEVAAAVERLCSAQAAFDWPNSTRVGPLQRLLRFLAARRGRVQSEAGY